MTSTADEPGIESDAKQTRARLNIGKFLRANGTQLGIFGVFVAMWIFFIVSAPQTFLSPQIYLAFMSTIPFFAIMALPLTMAIIAGEMDRRTLEIAYTVPGGCA